PALGLVDADLRGDVQKAGRVWDLIVPQFQKVNGSLDNILNADTTNIGIKNGVMRMASTARYYKIELGSLALDILGLETAADSAQSSGAEFIVNILGNLASRIEAENRSAVMRNLAVAVGVSLLVIIGSIVFMLRFGRNLGRRVGGIESVMRRVAQKDLTVRTRDHAKDEIGTLSAYINSTLDAMWTFFGTVRSATVKVDELKDTISAGSTESAAALNQITKNIESIKEQFLRLDKNVATTTDAVTRIAAEISELTRDITRQSTSMNETSTSVEQMNASVENVARLSIDRKHRSDELTDVIRLGGQRIGATNDLIKSITREIDDILEIIEIINSVSDQTNLLSMNAAIESAHAGEAGKGFAVVAEEIRKLAESTSENASRIDRSLKSITGKIKEALDSSEESYRSYENVNRDVRDFAGAMTEISSNMDELSTGSREILRATGEIAGITTSIERRSVEMDSRARDIQSAMQEVREISAGAVGGMDEIDHGVKEILHSLVDMSEKTGESRERMDELTSILSGFTLDTDGLTSTEDLLGASRSIRIEEFDDGDDGNLSPTATTAVTLDERGPVDL
ncbi:MAG TPA: methyl-accepting chemotaxis protein, partial [Spirochaetia bacterium]|nr:methyl-accepting chemotaxis protein [Spirochaetia bacterium]